MLNLGEAEWQHKSSEGDPLAGLASGFWLAFFALAVSGTFRFGDPAGNRHTNV